MPKRSKNTSLQNERHKLGLPEIENKSRNVLAEEAHVHPLVLRSEAAGTMGEHADDLAWMEQELMKERRTIQRVMSLVPLKAEVRDVYMVATAAIAARLKTAKEENEVAGAGMRKQVALMGDGERPSSSGK